MKSQNLLSGFAAILLAGCSSLAGSHLPTLEPITGKDVFSAIACEIKSVVDANPELADWAADVTVTFSATSDILVVPNASWAANLGPVKVSTTGTGNHERNLTNTLPLTKTYPSLGKPLDSDCDSAAKAAHGLGVGAALSQQYAWVKGTPADVSLDKTVKNQGYTATFTVSREADGSLSFAIGPVNVKTDGSKAVAKDVNTVEVDFAFPVGITKAVDVLKQLRDNQKKSQMLRDAVLDAVETGATG